MEFTALGRPIRQDPSSALTSFLEPRLLIIFILFLHSSVDIHIISFTSVLPIFFHREWCKTGGCRRTSNRCPGTSSIWRAATNTNRWLRSRQPILPSPEIPTLEIWLYLRPSTLTRPLPPALQSTNRSDSSPQSSQPPKHRHSADPKATQVGWAVAAIYDKYTWLWCWARQPQLQNSGSSIFPLWSTGRDPDLVWSVEGICWFRCTHKKPRVLLSIFPVLEHIYNWQQNPKSQ